RITRRPCTHTLIPYTTLFRSPHRDQGLEHRSFDEHREERIRRAGNACGSGGDDLFLDDRGDGELDGPTGLVERLREEHDDGRGSSAHHVPGVGVDSVLVLRDERDDHFSVRYLDFSYRQQVAPLLSAIDGNRPGFSFGGRPVT